MLTNQLIIDKEKSNHDLFNTKRNHTLTQSPKTKTTVNR